MQLISIIIFTLSTIVLFGAILFLYLWHKAHRKSHIVRLLREGIGHIGISATVEYPETPAPLIALLEEEYPRSEAIIITDLQYHLSPFGELIQKFNLVKVNHTHLAGVRSLYRSRCRAFRRVVLVDLPIKYQHRAAAIGKEVASYNYVLHLKGESIVAHNALTYCANLIASHYTAKDVSLRNLVGAEALLERSDIAKNGQGIISLYTDRVLAWRKESIMFAIFAISAPAAIVLIAHLSQNRMVLITAITTSTAIAIFLYISCRVISEKSLLATLDTILRDFYRFLVEGIKKINYLYKERRHSYQLSIKEFIAFNKVGGTNRKSP